MEQIMAWLTHVNDNHHWGFAALTVAAMTGSGLTIGGAIELVFLALGVGYGKIEIKR